MSVQDERLKELLMYVDTNIKLEDVILSEENQLKIQQFIKENKFKEKLFKYRLQPMNRLLFYGDSGCGKTFLAKALSNHLNYKMLYIDIAKSLSDGSVAKNISDIFEISNSLGNCVIFLDECDSIAWNRDSTNSDGGVVRRATNSLFQQLDQMNKTNVFISATNMLHRLDPAFERRFNEKLSFRRPAINVLELSKRFIYPEFTVIDDANSTIKSMVNGKNRLSFYEIEDIMKKAMKRAVLNDSLQIRTSELYKDIASAMNIKVAFNTGIEGENI